MHYAGHVAHEPEVRVFLQFDADEEQFYLHERCWNDWQQRRRGETEYESGYAHGMRDAQIATTTTTGATMIQDIEPSDDEFMEQVEATNSPVAKLMAEKDAEIERLNKAWDSAYRQAMENEAALMDARAEVEALRKDAERYRWLRKGGKLWGICVWEDDEWAQDARTNVDSLIDAAMEKP